MSILTSFDIHYNGGRGGASSFAMLVKRVVSFKKILKMLLPNCILIMFIGACFILCVQAAELDSNLTYCTMYCMK